MSVVIEKKLINSSPLTDIAAKVYHGERLRRSDAIKLYQSDDLPTLAHLADFARKRKAGAGKEEYVYYIHNMHLNPTNFCMETCRFCSYANPSEQSKAYTWT